MKTHLLASSWLLIILLPCTLFSQQWRSELYPQDWHPGYRDGAGRFLPDFSYAGYHNGEKSLPSQQNPDKVYNVVEDFGADPEGKFDATPAIQQAIDLASQNQRGVVFLPAGLYRCDGVLQIHSSGIVLRGQGAQTKLYFSKSEQMGDQAHIHLRGQVQSGQEFLLAQDAQNTSATIYLQDASGLQVGDEVSVGWVITQEFVEEHQMQGVWKTFNGKWRPFFRREVVALDFQSQPHRVVLDVPLRYVAKVRDKASVRKESGYLQECGLEDFAISNVTARKLAWQQNRVNAILLQGTKDCWIDGISSFHFPNGEKKKFHLQSNGIKILNSKRVTVQNSQMEGAQNRGPGGNGYLFEVSRSNEILFRDCVAIAGRHNFIQNWDFGTSGCVFLRCRTNKSWAFFASYDPIGKPSFSEYHHSLAMACLVDNCELKDGWYGGNRRHWSSGAGHSVTQSVYWNNYGGGIIMSWQCGWGYVIGTRNVTVLTEIFTSQSEHTQPEDWKEGIGKGEGLQPNSLYEDQLRRRLQRKESPW